MASFRNEKYFLSNMYPCNVTINVNGELYTMKSSETVFQALRSPQNLKDFLRLDGFSAKRLSKTLKARDDWFDVNIDVMRYALRCKFTQNPDLAAKLIAIEGEIVEENEWHDTFWGVCNGTGKNWLGRLLMELRDELQNKDKNDTQSEAFMTSPIGDLPVNSYGLRMAVDEIARCHAEIKSLKEHNAELLSELSLPF